MLEKPASGGLFYLLDMEGEVASELLDFNHCLFQ